jgi:hypothetical protein
VELILIYMNVRIASNYIAISVEEKDARVVVQEIGAMPVSAGNNGKHKKPTIYRG